MFCLWWYFEIATNFGCFYCAGLYISSEQNWESYEPLLPFSMNCNIKPVTDEYFCKKTLFEWMHYFWGILVLSWVFHRPQHPLSSVNIQNEQNIFHPIPVFMVFLCTCFEMKFGFIFSIRIQYNQCYLTPTHWKIQTLMNYRIHSSMSSIVLYIFSHVKTGWSILDGNIFSSKYACVIVYI